MVNLSISPAVADSIVFHQEGDTLTHILELIWCPGIFTKFATLVLTNLATNERRRSVVLRRGGLAALIGLLLGSNYEWQVSACRALVNLALSPAAEVALFASDAFVDRLLSKLAPVDHAETQALVAALLRNLCVRPEFALALNKNNTSGRLTKLRDASGVRALKDGAGQHGLHEAEEEAEAEDVSKLVMFTTNTLQEFKTYPARAENDMRKTAPKEPITAEVGR